MKTILINICDSNMARNFLRTGALKELKSHKNIKIVALVPEMKLESYKKEFASDNIIVDILPKKSASFFELFSVFIARNSIPTHTVRQIQKNGLDGTRMKWHRYILALFFWLLGHIYFWRFLVAKISYLFFNGSLFSEVFKKYKPDLIFSPTIFAVNDLRFLKSARNNSVLSVGMIKSWDNLTSKDPLLLKPDWLIVHNEIVKEEALKLGHYPENKIFISGIPQFDVYSDPNFVEPKESFFKKMGLDSKKKLISFFAVGSYLAFHEREMIELLAKIVNSNKLKFPAQFLVRLHPAFTSDEDKLKSISNVVVDRPGKFIASTTAALRDGWEFYLEDTRHLASTLKWSDVVINFGSTTLIESAIYDTPVILTSFDAIKEKDYWFSAQRLTKREHKIPIVKSGGVKVAYNENDLISQINDYLDNPTLDKEGRARLVKEQCYKNDGKAGERIGKFLISLL